MSKLQGKIALVTGGGRGIGRSIALTLASEGSDVAVLARTSKQIEEVAAEIRALGRRSLAVTCDLADGKNITHAVATIQRDLGPIDILINNAAVVEPVGRTITIDPDQWAEALNINLIGPYRLLRAVLPEMLERGWGRIVSVSSGAAAGTGMDNGSAYATSKAALELLSLNIATELAGSGVTVNAVRPGVVDTDMQTHMRLQPAERIGQKLHDGFQSWASQLYDPSQPARLVANLVTSEITGKVVDIDDELGQELRKD